MRKALPYLIGAFCVLTLVGVGAGVWLSYDARSKAKQNAEDVAALSSDIASVQDSIDSSTGGDGSATTIDDLDSEIQDLQSSIDNLDTTGGDGSTTIARSPGSRSQKIDAGSKEAPRAPSIRRLVQ